MVVEPLRQGIRPYLDIELVIYAIFYPTKETISLCGW